VPSVDVSVVERYGIPFEITGDNVIPVLYLARYFAIESLQKVALEHMRSHLDENTAVCFLEDSIALSMRETQMELTKFVTAHFQAGCESLLSLPVQIVIDILSSDDLKVQNECVG